VWRSECCDGSIAYHLKGLEMDVRPNLPLLGSLLSTDDDFSGEPKASDLVYGVTIFLFLVFLQCPLTVRPLFLFLVFSSILVEGGSSTWYEDSDAMF